MMEYHICEEKTAAALKAEVRRFISKGWKPTGGISVVNSMNSGTWWYYQAMVLLSPDDRIPVPSEPTRMDQEWELA
jgi:hypothetical protein